MPKIGAPIFFPSTVPSPNIEKCRKNKFEFKWDGYKPIKPSFLGVKTKYKISIDEIEKFIDWKPFN